MSTTTAAGQPHAFQLTALDGLRGLAALYVVAHHARIYLWVRFYSYAATSRFGAGEVLAYAASALRFGHQAVIVFFLLSGFVIHLRNAKSLARGEEVRARPMRFLQRRAWRLLPPLLFALVLVAGLDTLGTQLAPALYAGFHHDARTFVMNVLFLQGFAAPTFGSDGALWSLSYEGAFYLLYPLFLVCRIRAGGRAAFALAFAAGGAGWLAALAEPAPVITIAPYFAIWALGALLAEAYARSTRIAWPAPMLSAGAALSGSVLLAGERVGQPTSDILFSLGVITFLGVLLLHPWGRWPATQLVRVRALGACSYTLYLIHMPVLLLMGALWMHGHGAMPRAGWLAVAGVAAAVALAFAVAPLVEAPFTARRDAGRAEPRAIGARRRTLVRRASRVVADIERRRDDRDAA